MKIVGLVSGGKDSCYNLVRCVALGHELVAIANLAPADAQQDECESHMFQTIGHNVISDLARCMGVPLYSSKLHGGSVRTDLTYERTQGDEVEDMYALLARVQQAHPDLGGVSSGAILSSYQRLRVEHVCSRLNLTSFAFLWQFDQSELLDEMIANDVRAVLLKVASMGLTPRQHLGRELGVLREHLRRIGDAYGVNVCGEGGEYETLTLDCPLFLRRMVLTKTEMVGDLRTDIAPVAVLRLVEWELQEKPEHDVVAACKATQRTARHVGFEREEEEAGDEGRAAYRKFNAAAASTASAPAPTAAAPVLVRSFDASVPVPSFPAANVVGDYCFVATASPFDEDAAASAHAAAAVSSSCAAASAAASALPDDAAVGASLTHCVEHVDASLRSAGFCMRDVLYVQLFLPSMSQFAAANATYKTLFSMVDAPSRACVQLAAPPADAAVATHASVPTSARMGVDCVASRSKREVLHVQSVSEWAPACIGPYSQASKIGLAPSSMTLPSDPREQAAWALRHCAQVLRALGSGWSHSVSCVLYWKQEFWNEQQRLIQGVIVPMVARRLHLAAEAAGNRQWDAAAKSIVHVAVPTLPRDALLEVQLIAAPLAPTLPLAVLSVPPQPPSAAALPAAAGFQCHLHASYAHGSFASVWSALTVADAASEAASDATAAATGVPLDAEAACTALVDSVQQGMDAVQCGWAQVLLLRVYLSPFMSERDVRVGLHRAMQARGVARMPALSIMHVADVQLQVSEVRSASAAAATAGPAASRARTILAAHLVLLADDKPTQPAAAAAAE